MILMNLPLVIDTSALRDRGFRYWLGRYHGRKILPAVAYTEICVYFIGMKNKTQEQVDGMLYSMGLKIEWFRTNEARKAAELGISLSDFSNNARDYMIAAHAYTAPWVVVTYDSDFDFLGTRAKTPQEIMGA